MTFGKCEACDREATSLRVDYVEQEPREGDDGERYRAWKPDGKHRFCATHLRPSRKRLLDGTVTEKPVPARVGDVLVEA